MYICYMCVCYIDSFFFILLLFLLLMRAEVFMFCH